MKKGNIFYVYCHINTSTNLPFYIGAGHGNRAYDGLSRNNKWDQVVNNNNYTVSILFDNLSDQEAFQIERDTIRSFKSNDVELCNLTDGGKGVYNPVPEVRLKMRERQLGKIHSPETRAKMSLNSPRHSKNKGKVRSDEFKANVAAFMNANHPRRRIVIANTGERFNSLTEAAKWSGLKDCTHIASVCNGKRSTSGKHPELGIKLKWRYE